MRTSILAAILTLTALPALAQDGLDPGVYVELETSKGTMFLRLFHEKAPRTVANFVGLVEGTKRFKDKDGKLVKRPFYDGLTFHRVISDFMIQGGCPNGDGMGGPGYRFQDETVKGLTHAEAGILSMANSDKNKSPWSNSGRTNGSQFFITLRQTEHLDGLHTVFGKLIKGKDVLTAIGKVATAEGSKPTTPVTIKRARVVRIGVGNKTVGKANGKSDPTTQPKKDAAPADKARVELICVQFKGCERARAEVGRSQAEALKLMTQIEGFARVLGAKFSELAKRYSDLPVREFNLVRAKNSPSLLPAFKLAPGQVSLPFVTPYGVMIAKGK